MSVCARRGVSAVLALAAGVLMAFAGVAPAGGAEDPASVIYDDRSESPRALHQVDGDGTRTRLTEDVDVIQPAWSPDGDRVAFAGGFGDVTGEAGLYVVDADGGTPSQLVSQEASYPAWSPDGQQLAFRGEDGHLWVVGADGEGLRQVTTAEPANFLGDIYPSWSPDGSDVAFTRLIGESPEGEVFPDEVRVVSVATGAERQVAQGSQSAWSPTGEWIAFARDGATHVVRPDGSQTQRLAAGQFGGAWSPDGAELAVPHERSLRAVEVSSGQVRTVVADAGAQVTEPSWSGAGRWLAYSAADAFRVPADADSPDQISDTGGGREPATWPGITRRAAGPSRIETAAAVSRQTHESADTVIVASTGDYPDALAGASLAGMRDAPVLLTPRGGLHSAVAAEIDRLGASQALLLGGENALTQQVADDLADRGLAVDRVSGPSRFHTAAEIAGQLPSTSTAYVVQGASDDPGRGWPDAVAVSGLAAFHQRPVLLTLPDRLPAPTRQALADHNITDVTVVGGASAVSDDVVDELAAEGIDVDRIAGATRYATSLELADHAVGTSDLTAESVWLATGRNWPDSLAAGPASAAQGGLLVLVDGQQVATTPTTFAWLDQATPTAGVVAGGADMLHPAITQRLNRSAAQ